ncbi:MAG: hypothetical protein EPO61_03150 [Nitrospirae bacterium]|nr:MAG: hypothetical protein EPO61_03150 [Nitrospirota bacterium]
MRLVLVGWLLLMVPLGGCQTSVSVRVEDEVLAKPAAPANLKVTLLSKARDIRDKPRDQVGRHFFLFMPGPQVKPEDERLDRAIAKSVKTALEVSGYSVATIDRLRDATGPVVVVQIDDLRNNLFIFPYPLAAGWGKMRLSLHVLTPDGKELWADVTEGHWGVMAALFYMAGFEMRVQSDLKANLNQIIAMVSSEEFKKQIRP